MAIRIPCLVPGPKRQEIVLCAFDGEIENTEKVAARLLAALHNDLSAAVFDQLATFMVESATASITPEGGYKPKEVRQREKIVTWLTSYLLTRRRRPGGDGSGRSNSSEDRSNDGVG